MALNKTPISITFAGGLDGKTDPYQIQLGKFTELVNSVFDTTNRLSKRNGFPRLTTLPNAEQTNLTTLNNNLIATGSNLYAWSSDTDTWLDQGIVQPVQLETQALIRSTTEQQNPDAAVSDSGLTCLVYIDDDVLYYQISDSETGQQVVARQVIVDGVASPRVYVLGRYFVITYIADIAGSNHLQYIAIPIPMPSAPIAAADISATLASPDAGYDAYVANNNLYVAWSDATDIIGNYITSTLVLQSPIVLDSGSADLVSVTADESGNLPVIYVSFWNDTSDDGFTGVYDHTFAEITAPTQIITNIQLERITSVANDGLCTVFYEVFNEYAAPYPTANVQTNYIASRTIEEDGTLTAAATILRSVGLASKAFLGPTDEIYVLVAYGETNQETYFLINASGDIVMRLAYSVGGGYYDTQVLPNVSILDSSYYIPYLITSFLAPVNKLSLENPNALPAGQPVNAIYTQTGVNIAIFSINDSSQMSSEIANCLHLTGGQLWMYDGVKPVENGFHIWPENIALVKSNSTGTIANGTYYYAFCYEWTDNQGNLHRSAPSIPQEMILGGAEDTITCYVPTLRLTYKTAPNSVRIVGYRWSQAQQVYYQFTSLTSPTYNNPAVDFVVIIDTLPDASIIGNTELYTNGGVLENIAAPASRGSTLFKNRLFLIDAENPNLLWYSKQVIQGVPVEMSDLLTLFVAPTSGAQGSTGPITALAALDDKLIIFKRDAIYYLTGTGPAITGANNDFTDPLFITSSVGCSNPDSIVLMPTGLMFKSDKGIWLLGRDLSTIYIGDAVENFNDTEVVNALAIPGTNQVRFTLEDSQELVYDYYQQQWGTFSNIQSISACLFNGKHTYLTQSGMVNQESEGEYKDGAGTPVLMSFVTPWINVAGLQGYERFYFMYLLGTYYSPFKLDVNLAYDYNPSSAHNIIVTPDNFTEPWGGEAVWGSGGPWGGPGNPFEARLFPAQQKCSSFQVSIQEVYDATMGQAAGQGLALSGLNMIIGGKKGFRTQKASRSFG